MLFKNFFILASLAVLAQAKVNLHSLKQCGNFYLFRKKKYLKIRESTRNLKINKDFVKLHKF